MCSFAACIAHAVFAVSDGENVTIATSDEGELPNFESDNSIWWRLMMGFESLDIPNSKTMSTGLEQLLVDVAVLLCSATLTILLTLGQTTQCGSHRYLLRCTTHRHIGMLALPSHACGSKLPVPLVWFVFVPILMLAATWDPTVLSAINFAILIIAAISLRCGGLRTRKSLVAFLGIVLTYNLLFVVAMYLYMGIPFLVNTVPSLNASSPFGQRFMACTGNGNWIHDFKPQDHFPTCYWIGFRTYQEAYGNDGRSPSMVLANNSRSTPAEPLAAVGTFSWFICSLSRVALVTLSSLMLNVYREPEYRKQTSDTDPGSKLNATSGDSFATVRSNYLLSCDCYTRLCLI